MKPERLNRRDRPECSQYRPDKEVGTGRRRSIVYYPPFFVEDWRIRYKDKDNEKVRSYETR